MSYSSLPAAFVVGARVESRHFVGRLGTITRVIDAEGELGGLVEVRWDGQRVSRSAGFFSPQEIKVVEEATTTMVRHPDGLIWFELR